MIRLPRRTFCSTAVLGAVAALAQESGGNSSAGCEDHRLRIRAESLDELLRSARTALEEKKLNRPAYAAIVEWLSAMQGRLYDEARAHHFTDITEGTYWQRSRLKFPSIIDEAKAELKP
jgi:hypothetical protein